MCEIVVLIIILILCVLIPVSYIMGITRGKVSVQSTPSVTAESMSCCRIKNSVQPVSTLAGLFAEPVPPVIGVFH